MTIAATRSGNRSAQWVMRGVAMALMSLLLASCESVPVSEVENQNSYLKMFRLAQVDVEYRDADRPLLVDALEGDVKRSLPTPTMGDRLVSFAGLGDDRPQQAALEQEISAYVKPHVQNVLQPLFTGERPLRAVVHVKSVFVRSRLSLQQLTGAQVTVNGKRRPDNAQFVAALLLFDLETGLPVQHVDTITKIDDGSITIAGGPPKAPSLGKAERLNQLVYEFALAAANALRNNASSDDLVIPGSEGDTRIISKRYYRLKQ